MRRGTLISLCLSGLLCSGCSYLNREIPSLNLPEPEVSTTSAGAASGAAVGAGLGLVLGSMSGDAGKGLVVGSVAGAATGGLIGRGLENQEDRTESQRNALAVQQEVLREQGEDLERLRRGAQDGLSSNDFSLDLPKAAEPYPHPPVAFTSEPADDLFGAQTTPDRQAITEALLARNQSSSSARQALGSTYRRSSRVAKAFNPSLAVSSRDAYRAETRARMKTVVEPVKPQRRSISSIAEIRNEVTEQSDQGADNLVTLDSISPIITSKKESAANIAPVPAKKAKINVPAALTEPVSVSEKTGSQREAALNEVIGVLPPAKQSNAVMQEVSENIQASETTSLVSDRCADAAEEARKARLSPSKSNKLFYFRRAMRLCPDAPEFHLEVGYLYAALGRNDDARIEFDRVVELDSENVEAREQLSLLSQ